MANYADVKINIQQGGQGGSTAPPTDNGWLQAKSEDGNGNWTVDSGYWFYYSGGNGNGHGGSAGGEVDIPASSGGTFTVGPSGNEVIHQISFVETESPPPSTPNYTQTGPVNGIYTISDRAHEDPTGDTDAFDVYAYVNNSPNGTLLMCDPIIRNTH